MIIIIIIVSQLQVNKDNNHVTDSAAIINSVDVDRTVEQTDANTLIVIGQDARLQSILISQLASHSTTFSAIRTTQFDNYIEFNGE